MKTVIVSLALALVVVLAFGQTFNAPASGWGAPVATNISQCPTVAAHAAAVCPVEATPGVISYFLWNGSAWATATPSGVASFNGRTGAVVAASGDYAYSQISGTPAPPTSLNSCATYDLGGNAASPNLAGCKIQ